MVDTPTDAPPTGPTSPAAPEPVAAPRGRRADARLNMDAIVRAAAGLLAVSPRASMGEVATAAGLHRATVHRHFPSRDDLLAAVRDQAFAEGMGALERDAAGAGTPRDVLEAVVRGQLAVHDRFRMYRYAPMLESRREVDRPDRLRPMREAIDRAQRAGAVRVDLSSAALAVALAGLITTAAPELAQGRMTMDDATDFCLVLLHAPGA